MMEAAQTKLVTLISESQGLISQMHDASRDLVPNIRPQIDHLQAELTQQNITLEPCISSMRQTKETLGPLIQQHEKLISEPGLRGNRELSERQFKLFMEIRQTSDPVSVLIPMANLSSGLARANYFILDLMERIGSSGLEGREPQEPERRWSAPLPPTARPPSTGEMRPQALQTLLRALGYRPSEIDVAELTRSRIVSVLPELGALRGILDQYPTKQKMHWLLLLVIHHYQGLSQQDKKQEKWIVRLKSGRINRFNEFLHGIDHSYLVEADNLYRVLLDILKEPRYLTSLRGMDQSYKMAKRIVREILRSHQTPRDIVWKRRLKTSDLRQGDFVLTPTVFHWVQMILHRRVTSKLLEFRGKYQLEEALIAEAVLNKAFENPSHKDQVRNLLTGDHESKFGRKQAIMDALLSGGPAALSKINQLRSCISESWRDFEAYQESLRGRITIEFNSPIDVLHRPLQTLNDLTAELTPAAVEVLAVGFELSRELEGLTTSLREVRQRHLESGRLDLLAHEEIRLIQEFDPSFLENRSVRILQSDWQVNELHHDIYHLLNHLLAVLGKDYHERVRILTAKRNPIVAESLKIMDDLQWFRINLETAGHRMAGLAERYRDFLNKDILPFLDQKRHAGLVQDTFDFIASLADMGSRGRDDAEVNVSRLLEELVHSYQMIDQFKGIEIELTQDPQANVAKISPGSLRRVMRNLLDNAIDAMGTKGRLFIRVRTDFVKRNVLIEVQDTGSGIEPPVLEKIFNPFFTTKEQGSGMGLAIVKQTLEFHGGSVQVKSKPISQFPKDHGTVFTLTLPSIRVNQDSLDSYL